jgi:hypothetical protein
LNGGNSVVAGGDLNLPSSSQGVVVHTYPDAKASSGCQTSGCSVLQGGISAAGSSVSEAAYTGIHVRLDSIAADYSSATVSVCQCARLEQSSTCCASTRDLPASAPSPTNAPTQPPLQFLSSAVNLGGVLFGTTSLGYGFRRNWASDIIMIQYSGKFASDSNPGGGWVASAVARYPDSLSLFFIYWINHNAKQFEKWLIDSYGFLVSSLSITYLEYYAVENSFGVDIDGDSKIGLSFFRKCDCFRSSSIRYNISRLRN